MSNQRRPKMKGQFIMRPIDFIRSPSIRVASLTVHRILLCLESELCHHGGKDNGKMRLAQACVRQRRLGFSALHNAALRVMPTSGAQPCSCSPICQPMMACRRVTIGGKSRRLSRLKLLLPRRAQTSLRDMCVYGLNRQILGAGKRQNQCRKPAPRNPSFWCRKPAPRTPNPWCRKPALLLEI